MSNASYSYRYVRVMGSGEFENFQCIVLVYVRVMGSGEFEKFPMYRTRIGMYE